MQPRTALIVHAMFSHGRTCRPVGYRIQRSRPSRTRKKYLYRHWAERPGKLVVWKGGL